MTYEFYKVMHLIGMMLVFTSVGTLLVPALSKQARQEFKARSLASSLHGIGMLLLIVAGFGMLAKNKIPWQTWLSVKTLVWVYLGMFPMFAFRQQQRIRLFLALSLLFGSVAIYLAIYKTW